ncbi:FkbM family methyltransferase [Pseudooceanicola sp. C21-150M6]|uniref:FkbM family methyltransferase n=1 Tax=Pseudooceanicola sp. C21-150M6 TaxID=3434355 RepID=UPI003D7F905D
MKCAVITPVGPGHLDLFNTVCAPSVEQAKSYNMGPFAEVRHVMMDDTEGRHGRSARRNEGIAKAARDGCDWIFFLDADDVLTPNAFEAFGRVIAEEPDLEAVWGLICTFDPGGEPELRDSQAERLDSREDFLRTDPYNAIQIGGFYRTDAVAAIGFDVDMDAGEDYNLYRQLWAGHRCAKRPEIFFINQRGQHSTGPRSATGGDWTNAVTGLWREELGKVSVYVDLKDASGSPEARMRLTNPTDIIQNTHVRGRFFEAGSLEKLKRILKVANPRILEVGANIGNHVVWYSKHLDPARIYPVEPNPDALRLLEDNIDANGIGGYVDRRGMGYGAGRSSGRFRTQQDNADNLGATRLVADDGGGIETKTLDALMGEDRVDFIKIDAEGMEFDVLDGAQALIARDRPVIWIEVKRENMLAFAQAWCRDAGYRIVDSTSYINTIDYFAVPKE